MSEATFLEEITIKNIGIIEEAQIEFSNGLTVLSGETGAGKTMALTALHLILGGKSDGAYVRGGSDRLIASGRFFIPKSRSLYFQEHGLEIENDELIITRTVSSDGKSKASVNGIAVPISTLVSISSDLVSVYAQAANIAISKGSKQRELLDSFGGSKLAAILLEYRAKFELYHHLKSRIASMRMNLSQRSSELLLLQEFVQAFRKLNPQVNELEDIEAEINKLSSIEELRQGVTFAVSSIEGEESGSLTTLGFARKSLDSARNKDPQLEKIYKSVNESFYLLVDANSALNSYLASLDADPDRLEGLNLHKAALNSFIKRFAQTLESNEAIAILQQKYAAAADVIADLEGGDDRLAQLESELSKVKVALKLSAIELTKIRIETANNLQSAVTQEVQQLSMPHTIFHVKVASPSYESALKESEFTLHGCDEIVMYIQGNSRAPLVPVAKGASGGEMSRIMLALEVVVAAARPVGTYVFDEVDAGVGGKAAIEVGRRLHMLAQRSQVIVVTHLPQVAAWADAHFVVTKSDDGSVAQSNVRLVTDNERVAEIARMLAGFESSISAQEHAVELLALKIS